MDLIRLDSSLTPENEYPDDHRQVADRVEKIESHFPEDSKLRVDFKRFGRGAQRQSDFAVEMTWIDVSAFVRGFIEMRHPHALHLARMIKLAEAVEDEGWIPDDPPSEDFWSILPSSQ
jgi:hypothetical protein